MSQIIIVEQARPQQDAITIEEAQKRRIQRRRRVAKRLLIRFPLFAVEIMQTEFPGYTYDEFVADVTRKTRKGKSFRRPKLKGFDWQTIQREIPEFFLKCVQRTKTKAVLRGRLSSGIEFTLIARSVWFDGSGQRLFRTYELIRLWKENNLLNFCKHPAMILEEHKPQPFTTNP